MLKLNEIECVGERPLRVEKIISTEVVSNPFVDIKPRSLKAQPTVVLKKEDETKKKVVK